MFRFALGEFSYGPTNSLHTGVAAGSGETSRHNERRTNYGCVEIERKNAHGVSSGWVQEMFGESLSRLTKPSATAEKGGGCNAQITGVTADAGRATHTTGLPAVCTSVTDQRSAAQTPATGCAVPVRRTKTSSGWKLLSLRIT